MNRRFALKSLLATGSALALPMWTTTAALAASTHKVEIRGFKFKPKTLNVKVGDTVVFTNTDGAQHTVTAVDRSWDSKNLGRGDTFELKISADMDTNYFCRIHPNMKGFLKIDG